MNAIVERLRAVAATNFLTGPILAHTMDTAREAADEIEKLERQLNDKKARANAHWSRICALETFNTPEPKFPYHVTDGTDNSTSAPESGVGWQPIETAPKDGSHMLLGCPTYVDSGYWDEGGWTLYPDDRRPEDHYCQRFHPEPTHWMPLPVPPPSPPPAGRSDEPVTHKLNLARGTAAEVSRQRMLGTQLWKLRKRVGRNRTLVVKNNA